MESHLISDADEFAEEKDEQGLILPIGVPLPSHQYCAGRMKANKKEAKSSE